MRKRKGCFRRSIFVALNVFASALVLRMSRVIGFRQPCRTVCAAKNDLNEGAEALGNDFRVARELRESILEQAQAPRVDQSRSIGAILSPR